MANIKPVTTAKAVAAAVLTASTANTATPSIEQRVLGIETTLKAYFKTAETDAVSDFERFKAWLIANWPHFVTWGGGLLAFFTGHLKIS